MAGLYCKCMFKLSKNAKLHSKMVVTFYTVTAILESTRCPTSSSRLGTVRLFHVSHSNRSITATEFLQRALLRCNLHTIKFAGPQLGPVGKTVTSDVCITKDSISWFKKNKIDYV